MPTHRAITVLLMVSLSALAGDDSSAAEMSRIAVSDDRRGFVSVATGEAFVPWGFNYDHDDTGRLIEDYWEEEWDAVAEDFREMRDLGANVVRVHLQFGRFMTAADSPNPDAIRQLRLLLTLAEETGLYLDLTGLACYHKPDVPEWYDQLEEQPRWDAQARFWEAIAAVCADSPAVFCYDLMNEPVVPGGNQPQENWLGPPFADKYFVQFITRDRRGRPRPEIAKAWIDHLVAAIRRHDSRHLVTVGLVPWSLDRPGLTSGFVPAQVAVNLDFVAVHVYPESQKVPEALDTLKGFDIGKPVVIEEMFPLKCSTAELRDFIHQSRGTAAGWIGFYWGTPLHESAAPKSIGEAITREWLLLFRDRPHAH